MASAFVEAPWFKKALERVFKEIDEDGSGAADENEIYIGVLLTFNKLNSTFPFHVNPPTKNEIRELMKEFDKNRNNKLDQNEFELLVKALFNPEKGGKSVNVLRGVLKSFAYSALLVPGIAHVAKRGLSAAIPPPWRFLIKAAPTSVIAPLVSIGIQHAGSFVDSKK